MNLKLKQTVILLSILSLFVITTHQISIKFRHQLIPRYNQSAYTDELNKRQNQFDTMITTIQQQIRNLDANISSLDGNDTYQFMKLQEGLADQRDSIYDIQNLLNKPFIFKPCQKLALSDQQKAKLNQQIAVTNQSLYDMKAQVKKCTDQSIDNCTVTDQIIHQITRTQLYLNVMNDYVNGNCRRVPKVILPQTATGLVDLDDRLFKDNIKAPNWVYGNITEDKYRLIIFAETTKFNTTTCPIQTPFANKINNTCFNCPKGSIFSLGQRICTCQQGYKFDQDNNQCVSLNPIRPCDQEGTCISMCPKDRPRWNSVNKICEACPVDKPIANRKTSNCEACPQTTPIWNQLTYSCQSCPKTSYYDQKISKCILCKDDQKYDQNTKNCTPICQVYQIYSRQEGKCYTLQELNGCKCNQKYNSATKQCEDTCENNLQWLPSEKKCGPPSLPELKDKCKYYQRPSKDNKQCENYCDSSVAWYDRQNHVCIKIGCSVECKCGQLFDNLTGKCIPRSHQCPPQQFYSTTSNQCEIFCPNAQVYNNYTKKCQTLPNCAVDQIYNQQLNKCVKRCIDSFQTYNYQLQICQCMNGYHFDSSTKKCVVNSILCGKNQNYENRLGQCVCLDGYIRDSSNNCVPICDSRSNKVYDPLSNRCNCSPGYVLSSDRVSCVSITSTCLSSNNVHYDYASNACVCDIGYNYNFSDGRCYQNIKKCNESLHFVLNPQNNQCYCANGYRLSLDGQYCLSLAQICLKNGNTFFNSITLTCQCLPGLKISSQTNDAITCSAACKVDEIFNQLTQQCVKKCPSDFFYDTITKSCAYRCEADYVFNNLTFQCEKSIKICPDPTNQFYDKNTNQCHQCPNNYRFNPNTLLCQMKIAQCLPNQFYDDLANLCKYCKTGQTYNTVSKVCQYSNINCTGGMYFDFNLGQCKYCPAGYIYDELLLDCRNNCTVDQIYDYNAKVCILISSTCILDLQYYDSVLRKCINKPLCSSIQRYDEISRKCVEIQFITSKTAANLIHSNFRTYEAYYDSRKASDIYLKDCPEKTPFYSTSSKYCVFCPEDHTYFDLQAEKCLDCDNDKYDANIKKCVSLIKPASDDSNPQDFNYSLDRLIMNIV